MSFRQIKHCQSKTNKHDSENLVLSKYYLYGISQIKNVLKESVLDMELKSRNGLGHSIPWKYNAQGGPCEK